ncbi:MAG: NUDIX domain-containing protein [Candidatus Pacebacteria bacterium]|nr:NUDIX domain-containing protein [Candidatus Paceibacterota bacterium]
MNEKELSEATLGFLIKDGHVWLAIKTRNIGKDRWNGYGGGMEPEDKNIVDCLKREVLKECEVEITEKATEKVAVIDFHNTKSDGKTFVCKVHVFLIREWSGTPKESEEMASPTEFEMSKLPLENMMAADKEWLPIVLAGEKLVGEYHYGPFQQELIKEGKFKMVKELPGEHLREFKIH